MSTNWLKSLHHPARQTHPRRTMPVFALFALALAGPAVGSASAQSWSDGNGHVYLDDNTTGVNTIAGYSRSADGSLTALPGSPFVAGGAGLGTGLGSQDAIQTADRGRYLLAVDAGSNRHLGSAHRPRGVADPRPGQPLPLWRS